MPSIFTPTPAEIERKKPGIGGKPPVTRRPTGGGGGGGDDDFKNQDRGPGELPSPCALLCILRPRRRRPLLLHRDFCLLRQSRGHGHGPAQPHLLSQLASRDPAPDPLSQHRAPRSQQCHHGAGAPPYLPRDRRARGVAWPRPPRSAQHSSVDCSYAGSWNALPHRPGSRPGDS